MNIIRRLLQRFFFAEETITAPDGTEYTRRWPVSEKQPRPDGRWRRLKGRRR